MEMKEAMKQSASRHDAFFKQLEDSADGFSTVAEYFGRGIFDKSSSAGSGAGAGAAGSTKPRAGSSAAIDDHVDL
jgi:hypothetical protein